MKKRVIIPVAVLIVFDIAVTLCANAFVCSYFDRQISDVNTRLTDALSKRVSAEIKDGDTESADDYFKNRLHVYINGLSLSCPFIAAHYGLFDDDNNLICETDDEIFIVETDKQSEADSVTYICTVKNKDELYDYLFLIDNLSGETSRQVYSIARKGFECYVTEMVMEYTDGAVTKEERYKYNGEIEPGFEPIEAGDNIKIFSPLSNRPESVGYRYKFLTVFKSLSARNDERYNQFTEKISFSEIRSESKDYNYSFFFGEDSIRELTQTIYGSEGKEYHLVSQYSFNIKAFFLSAVLMFYLFTVIVAVIAFGIVRKVKKGKKKQPEYRLNK